MCDGGVDFFDDGYGALSLADSIKTNSSEREKESPAKSDGKDKGSSSRAEKERFESLQKELLLTARKRAEAASSRPPPSVATDEYVPATPTRIGQPAFRELDSDFTDGETRQDVEQADTVPSFPSPAMSDSKADKSIAESASDAVKKSPQVVVRAEVVVVDVAEQAAPEEGKGPERRETQRVMLRDSSAPAARQEEDPNDIDDPTGPDESTQSSDGGYIQSEAIAFDEFTVDGPLMTSTQDAKRQPPSSASDIAEVIPGTSFNRDAAPSPRSDAKSEPDAIRLGRSSKRVNRGLAAVALVLVAAAGLFFLHRWEKPSATQQLGQDPGARTTSPESASTDDTPMTQVTSTPTGAELVHQGAVVGNTPTKVKRPTYEQIFLLRHPGYESQLLRISPTSGETLHVTLRPSDTAINQPP